MKLRKLVALAAGSAAAAALVLPAAPAQAAAAVNCTLVGRVTLSAGIKATTPTTGNFTFQTTVMACAGSVSGVATVSATGTYNNANAATGTFAGTFNTSAFTVGGTCSGSVTAGVRVGTVVEAGVTASCANGVSGSGAVALSFVADPTSVAPDGTVFAAHMQGDAAFAQVP